MNKIKFKRKLLFSQNKLANKISLKTPRAFQGSVNKIRRGGVTPEEHQALRIAKLRASAQVKRPNLSLKERTEFLRIANSKLPRITRRKK